jgi:surface protein
MDFKHLLFSLCFIFLFCLTSLSAQDPFKTEWVPDDDSITIPVYSHLGYSYNYDITWTNLTDGSGGGSANGLTDSYTIKSLTPGDTYEIAISGTFPAISLGFGGNMGAELRKVTQWGDIHWLTFEQSFGNCPNLTITATDAPDLTEVTNMTFAFWNCSSLTTVPSMNSWDMSNVKTTYGMFSGASNFNANIGSWVLSSDTTLSLMFEYASNFNQDIGSWDVSNVRQMNRTFAYASVFNQYIGGWNTSKVWRTTEMFLSASAFNQDIGNWDMSKVESCDAMFREALSFNQDISSWNVSNVVKMGGMFENAIDFNQNIGSWDVSKVDDMSGLFAGATDFNQDISAWDVSNVEAMFGTFAFTEAFNQDLSNWDVSNVQSMNYMFYGANAFDQNIGSWNLTKLTTAENMFDADPGKGISCSNFGKTITGWDANTNTPSGITIGVLNRQYPSDAQDDYDDLKNNKGWTFVGSTSVCAPLPITLINFSATSMNANTSVLLSWETTQEENSDYFSILKSSDGITWNKIGQEAAKGYTTAISKYKFTDPNPEANNYYRLKEVDLDGKITYSKIRQVAVRMNHAPKNSITPNPNDGSFTINGIPGESYAIYDCYGKLILKDNLTSDQVEINLLNKTKGMYVVHFTDRIEKFFVQ